MKKAWVLSGELYSTDTTKMLEQEAGFTQSNVLLG